MVYVTHLQSDVPQKYSVQFSKDLQPLHTQTHTHIHTHTHTHTQTHKHKEALDYSNPGTGGVFLVLHDQRQTGCSKRGKQIMILIRAAVNYVASGRSPLSCPQLVLQVKLLSVILNQTTTSNGFETTCRRIKLNLNCQCTYYRRSLK